MRDLASERLVVTPNGFKNGCGAVEHHARAFRMINIWLIGRAQQEIVMPFTAKLQREVRSAERHPVDLGGTLRNADLQPFDVNVTDLSTDGFYVEGFHAFSTGIAVSIGLPGLGSRRALVVHAGSGGCGCRFFEPLDAAELSAAMTAIAMVPISFPLATHKHLAFEETPLVAERYSLRARVAVLVVVTLASWGVVGAARLLIG